MRNELKPKINKDINTVVGFTKNAAICPFRMEYFKDQEEELSHILFIIAHQILCELKMESEWEPIKDPLDKCTIKNIYVFDTHPPNGIQMEKLEQNIMLKVSFGIRRIQKRKSILSKLHGKEE